MNIRDIIFKKSPQNISIDELSFVVQEYIFEKTGKKVTINIYKDIIDGMPESFQQGIFIREMKLLNFAYDKAVEYFKNKLN